LRKARRGFDDSSSPSASLASRDILFPGLVGGRKAAECRLFGSLVRTTRADSEARFGPFSVSLRPLSPTQPNHAHFGTDVGSSVDQWVTGDPKKCGFEGRPLRRCWPGSNHSVRYGPGSSPTCKSGNSPIVVARTPHHYSRFDAAGDRDRSKGLPCRPPRQGEGRRHRLGAMGLARLQADRADLPLEQSSPQE
jgi:hypothetical protein